MRLTWVGAAAIALLVAAPVSVQDATAGSNAVSYSQFAQSETPPMPPRSSYGPSETEPMPPHSGYGPSTDAPTPSYGGDMRVRGGVCRSEAYDKADAEEYCESQLKCADKTPPKKIHCSGHTRRWICRCR